MVAVLSATAPGMDQETIRLAGRLTYGVDRSTAETARRLGYAEFVEWQLDYEAIDDSELEALLHAALPTLSMDADQLAELFRDETRGQQAQRELLIATLVRQAFSPRQLYQRMVEFWSDHFNVTVSNPISGYFKALEDRAVIRPLAMGRFDELLQADARSPAMLYYLDNFSNSVHGPNENYARELLELHTLGVDGGYTETDVKEAARVFTGWSIRPPGNFAFDPRNHDFGEKWLLGRHFPAGRGEAEGSRFLQLLAGHEATSARIAAKLVRRFVSDQPDPLVIQAVAGQFVASGGDLRATLRALLLHPNVRVAPPVKLKRPNEFIAGALRALELTPRQDTLRETFDVLAAAGQLPFQWPAPNGYPDAGAYWQSSNGFLVRFNAAAEVARLAADAPLLRAARSYGNPRRQTEFLAAAMLPQGIAAASLAQIVAHAAALAPPDRPAAIATLLLAGPEYQWR